MGKQTAGMGEECGAALTPREREVLALTVRGLARKRIAQRLGITERTVLFHLASLRAKLKDGKPRCRLCLAPLDAEGTPGA